MPFEIAWNDPTIQKLLLSLVAVLLALVLVRLGRRLVPRYAEDPARQFRAIRLIGRVVAVSTVIVILALWSPRGGDVLTILTVIGAGLAIAMREVLLSFIGWLHLIVRGTYRRGDRIEVNDRRGDVVDIRLMHTVLMEVGGWVAADQSSGRLVHIPNSWIYQYGVHNYNHGFNFIWNELSVTVTFRSDWEAAQEIMLQPARQTAPIVEQQANRELRALSREFLVHYGILSPFVYVRIAENGIRLTLRYLCEVRKRRGTEHAFTLTILKGFKEHGGIELAYPMVGVAPMDAPQFAPLQPDTPPPEHPATAFDEDEAAIVRKARVPTDASPRSDAPRAGMPPEENRHDDRDDKPSV